ncbi:MAG: STAS/SEC14 domain-containing protein [Bernardetiaceae bacterium]|nr:STAS/SEC14 domain-containing protein [Bernardetiaceae bacterium]
MKIIEDLCQIEYVAVQNCLYANLTKRLTQSQWEVALGKIKVEAAHYEDLKMLIEASELENMETLFLPYFFDIFASENIKKCAVVLAKKTETKTVASRYMEVAFFETENEAKNWLLG